MQGVVPWQVRGGNCKAGQALLHCTGHTVHERGMTRLHCKRKLFGGPEQVYCLCRKKDDGKLEPRRTG